MRLQKMKKGMALFFAFFLFATSLFSPIRSYAHDVFYLQVLIDEGTYQYQGNVIHDRLGWMDKESKHIENNTGDFYNYFKSNGLHKGVSADSESSDYQIEEKMGESPAPFSFPSIERGEGWGGKKKNNATKEDADRAYNIRDTLIPSLNDALYVLNGNKPFENTKSLIETASKLTNVPRNGSYHNVTVNGVTYKVKFGSNSASGRASYGTKLSKFQKQTLGVTDHDFMTIKTPSGEEYEFIYRMPKGYSKEQGYTGNKWNNKVYTEDYDYKEDVEYITWHMLVYQANYAMFARGWTMSDAYEITGVTAVEEFFVSLTSNLLNGLRNLLGLYSLNELIFNEGIRGSSAWVHGAMPETWHDNVVKYHMLFQALAWTLISLAVVKSLIQRNLATVNPFMRVSLIEQIQNLLITGFVLSFILPLISMFLFLNVKLVDMFSAFLAPEFTNFGGLDNYSNMLAGIVLQFFYFIVTLYLNFVYIMRSITLAILIAMAPLFVVSIAFGGGWKQLFGVWSRELLANIFLQSYHAFILGFFVTTTISSRGVEQMVLAFAMIPLTEFFRSMVMGQAGGIGHQLGMGSTMAALGTASKLLGAGRHGKNTVSSQLAGGDEEQLVAMETQNRSTYSREMAKTQHQPIKSVKPGYLEQKKVNDNRETPLGVYTKGTEEQKAMYASTPMSGKLAGLKDATKAVSVSSIGASAVSAGAGLFEAGLGAGTMLALGGASPFMMASATHAIGDGLDKAKHEGVAPVSAQIANMGASIREGFALDRTPKYNTPLNTTGVTSTSIGQQAMPNNLGYYVHRRASDVRSESGIISANMTPDGQGAVYHYDSSRLSKPDKENLDYYVKAFSSGDTQLIQHMRDHGVQNVAMRNDGGYSVTYNRVGLEQMGIQSVSTVGSGANARIVEQKRNDQSPSTYNTVKVPTPPPKVSTILNQHGDNFTVQRPSPSNSTVIRP